MPCSICGREEPVDDRSMCAACAARLAGFAAASSALSSAAFPALVAAPAESEGMSRLVQEFGREKDLELSNPFSVAVEPDGNLLVMDRPAKDAYRIARFNPDGRYVSTVVVCHKGSEPAQLRFPKGMAVAPHGYIFIPDAGNNRIQRFDPAGKHLGAIGSVGDGPGEFNFPCDVQADEAGVLYVADTANCRIQKLTPQGVQLMSIGRPAGKAGEQVEMDGPTGVALDRDHNILVADTNHHRVLKFSLEGTLRMAFGQEGRGRGMFRSPSDVRVDKAGVIFVVDLDNTRVQKFDAEGAFLSAFALEGAGPESGGIGGHVAVDDDSCILICNSARNTVLRIRLFDAPPPPTGESL